jgi:transcriptional regulator with XRE-family HTH domain
MKVKNLQPTLARVLDELLDEHKLDMRSLAKRCGVTYQTVKNVINGKSISMRFVRSLIREFQIDQNPPLLRCLLLGVLLVQLPPGEGERLLRMAGMLPKRK